MAFGLVAVAAIACGGSSPSSGREIGEIPVLTPTPGTKACFNDTYPSDAPAFGDDDAIEYKTLPSGVGVFDREIGDGDQLEPGDRMLVNYTGFFTDGCIFDTSRIRGAPSDFTLGRLIQGWQVGMVNMREGGKRRLRIPPALAYGAAGLNQPGFFIPRNSTLIFEVELVEVMKPGDS